MSITIVGPKNVTIPASMGGNDTIFGLTLVAATRGLIVEDIQNNQVKIKNISDYSIFPLQIVNLLLSEGCEIFGYQVWFDLTGVDLDSPVPETFQNRVYTIGDINDPETVVHTWNTWGDPVFELDNKILKSNQDRSNLGIPLPASLWAGLNIPLITVPEYMSMLPSVEL